MVPQLFDRWREADAAARAAEKEVLTASLEALDGRGLPPSAEALAEAKRLRIAADAMLNGALSSMCTAAERAGGVSRDAPESPPASHAA